MIGERSGSVVFRLGKGGKQRSVPLPFPARRAVAGIPGNPAADSVEQGLRRRTGTAWRTEASGPCAISIRCLDRREAASRIFFATRWLTSILADNTNDLVGLAQILGHENLNTTARYTKRTEGQLADATDRLTY